MVQQRLPTVAELLAGIHPSGVFQLVAPFAVEVEGAPWLGRKGVTGLVAFVNEAPDGALYAFVDPDDLDDNGWYVAAVGLGCHLPTDTGWTYIQPQAMELSYRLLPPKVTLVIAAARQIARFREWTRIDRTVTQQIKSG